MVSVVIATYNRPTLIFQTIQSLLGQTHSDLELIVVSDGPQADTRQVIENFRDQRLRYYEIPHSGRPAVPRNFAIKQAKGEYIAFCDDDDIWLPEKLSLQLAAMKADSAVGLVYAKVLLEYPKGSWIVPSRPKEGFIFKELFVSGGFIPCITVLIKQEVIKKVGIFDEDMRLKAVEDFDLWLRIARKYKIACIGKVLARARHSKNSDSLTEKILVKIKNQYIVPHKFYKKKYVGLGLFLESLLRMFFRSIRILIYKK